jgi:hypothetical protein
MSGADGYDSPGTVPMGAVPEGLSLGKPNIYT